MKTLLRILKWLGITILSLIGLVLLLLLLDGDARQVALSDSDRHQLPVQALYEPAVDSALYDSLLTVYGTNKTLLSGYEIQCLIALSHYPELRDARIEFVAEPAFLPLASRPDPLTVLFPWMPRTYQVIVSTKSEDFFEPILLPRVPYNAQIGVLGHELAHTLFYQDKSAFYLASLAYCYQFNDFIHDFERATDERAVAHGLGHQLIDYAYFVRRAFGQSEEQIEAETDGTYLSPNELRSEMQQYSFYQQTRTDTPAEGESALPDSLP